VRYDVTQHSLLSPAAKGLSAEALRQHNELAEDLLHLLDVGEFTDPVQLNRVKRAVVRQVNWQVMLDPDALMLKSKTVGIESETYRDGLGLIDTWAEDLLQPLLPVTEEPPHGAWEPIVSKRSP
jgi:hypothetical protein